MIRQESESLSQVLQELHPKDLEDMKKKGLNKQVVRVLHHVDDVEVWFESEHDAYFRFIPLKFKLKFNSRRNPPIVKFSPQLRHQSIFTGTGIMCTLAFSEFRWKARGLREIECVNEVISTLLTRPDETEYPVDYSIVDLYLNNRAGYDEYIRDLKQYDLRQW